MPRPTRAVFQERIDHLRTLLLRHAGEGSTRTAERPLPAEKDLARRSGVSRQTARRVIDDLVEQGILERRPYRGVFARPDAVGGATRLSDDGDRAVPRAAAGGDEAVVSRGARPPHAIPDGAVQRRTSTALATHRAIKLRIAIYDEGTERERLRKLFALYRYVAPEVDVQLVEFPATGYAATLAQLARHDLTIDAAFLMNYHFAALSRQARDLFHVLDGDVTGGGLAVRPPGLAPWLVGGVPYGIPLFCSPIAVACNLGLFAAADMEPPSADWSWEDLAASTTEIVGRLGRTGTPDHTTPDMSDRAVPEDGGLRLSADQAESDQPVPRPVWGTVVAARTNRWPMYVLQAGGALATPDGREALIATPAFRDALDFTVGLVHRSRVAPLFAVRERRYPAIPERLFADGQAALLDVSGMVMEEFGQLPFDCRLLPPPRHRQAATLLLVAGVAISRGAPHPEACRDLVDFLCSEAVADFLRLDSYCPPARRPAGDQLLGPSPRAPEVPLAASPRHVKDAFFESLLEQSRALTVPELLVLRAIVDPLGLALAGALPICQAIEQMQRVADEALRPAAA